MAAQDLRNECVRLCRVSLTLESSALNRLEQLVGVLEAHLQTKVGRLG